MRNLSRSRSGILFPGLLPAFALSAVAAIGCMQKLDARSAPLDDGNDGSLVTQIVPTANPISLDENDESKTTMEPCEKTRQDKAEILSAYCAACHSGGAAVGLPPWSFVLDDQKLVTELWTREGQPSRRFVIPGDPDHSAIYERMAIAQDMPPQPTDVGTHAIHGRHRPRARSSGSGSCTVSTLRAARAEPAVRWPEQPAPVVAAGLRLARAAWAAWRGGHRPAAGAARPGGRRRTAARATERPATEGHRSARRASARAEKLHGRQLVMSPRPEDVPLLQYPREEPMGLQLGAALATVALLAGCSDPFGIDTTPISSEATRGLPGEQ